MASLDIFNNDAFGVVSLTKAINDTPYQPGRIGQLGWFSEEGISTTSMMMERMGTVISLVPNMARGAPGVVKTSDKRKMVPIGTTHLPQRATVMADEVQNVRAFGSETEEEVVGNVVNKRLAKCRRDLDTTIEWQRIGTIKGQILDSDGTTVILDMFSTFTLTQQTVSLGLADPASKVRSLVVGAKRKMETALGALQYKTIRVLCGQTFFDAFVDHPAVQRAWDNFQDRMMLQQDLRGGGANGSQTAGFQFAGCTWEEYRGSISGQTFVAAGEAYMVPEGVAELFSTYFAPADYMETVNTMGLPYYAKQQLMDFNKGVEIETQSNPISVCTRPDAIIKLTA